MTALCVPLECCAVASWTDDRFRGARYTGAMGGKSGMYELSPQAFQLIYGMTFFVMGLAVIARVSAYPPSRFRNRLLALGASGLFHAAGTWLILESVTEIGLPSYIRQISYTAGYLALFYFAFGWSERRPMAAHAIALASIGGLLTADYFIAEPAGMHIVTRLGVGMPAIICAAVVFMRDSSFRFGSRPSPRHQTAGLASTECQYRPLPGLGLRAPP